jgi:RNA polymerase sigma factor (sigma-70 family)
LRQGDTDSAWRIVEILSDRATRFIVRHVAAWHILPQHREDCIQDVQDLLLLDLVDTGSKAEFWEVRFWLCLKRRLINSVQKYRRIADIERYPNDFADEGEATEDPLAKIADSKTLPPQSHVEIAEALALLKEQERVAFVLTHLQGWSQQEIAECLQVSDRTVRNLLTRAEQKLAQWREEMH